MQIYEAGYQALTDLQGPTHLRDLVTHIESRGYFSFGAKSPERALGVALDRHARGVHVYRPAEPMLFYRAGPATYGLLEWLDQSSAADVELDADIAEDVAASAELDGNLFLEKQLQEWLFRNLKENQLEALGYGKLELFDPGLQEKKQGKYWTGAVGEIDMLLRSASDDLLVIELKRESSDRTVGQICRYVGWVEEALATDRSDVHGLILALSVDDSLRYALKATRDVIRYTTISFDVQLGEPSR